MSWLTSFHDTPRASIHPRIQSSRPTKHVNSDWVQVWGNKVPFPKLSDNLDQTTLAYTNMSLKELKTIWKHGKTTFLVFSHLLKGCGP